MEEVQEEVGVLGCWCSNKSSQLCAFVGMMLEKRQWVRIVEIFSRCTTTFSDDKIVADSEMAQSLSRSMRSDYLAGSWRRNFRHQLLWKISHSAPMARINGTQGPSWSWASVDGTLEIPDRDGNPGTGLAGCRSAMLASF